MTGVLEDKICLLAPLFPVAMLIYSLDLRDVKSPKDHLVHLLVWCVIAPHSVFSSVLSHLIDSSGEAFVTSLRRHVSKYNRHSC